MQSRNGVGQAPKDERENNGLAVHVISGGQFIFLRNVQKSFGTWLRKMGFQDAFWETSFYLPDTFGDSFFLKILVRQPMGHQNHVQVRSKRVLPFK